jgi:hypothetical protein
MSTCINTFFQNLANVALKFQESAYMTKTVFTKLYYRHADFEKVKKCAIQLSTNKI